MTKKVCHITTVHPANDNRIFYKECTTLYEAGYEVSLIVTGGEKRNVNGIDIITIPKRDGRLKRFFRSALVDAYKAAKKTKADIFHFHDPELMFTGLMLRLSGKKVIYDVHENNPASIMSKPYIRSRLQRKLMSFFFNITEKTFARFFSGIVTARPDISLRFPKRNLVTLRNFPVLPDYNSIPDLEIKKDCFAVIYVGGMSLIRGTIELINAFEKLENTELWILGGFEDIELQQRCENLPGWKNVRWFGKVEPYEIFGYIKKADAGIINFLPVPNHITTLPTKPFEYMACGLPMIMSDFDYWNDFFGDSALYVNPADSSAIAEKIVALRDNPGLRKNMSERNLALARNEYNWQKEKEKLLELYNKL